MDYIIVRQTKEGFTLALSQRKAPKFAILGALTISVNGAYRQMWFALGGRQADILAYREYVRANVPANAQRVADVLNLPYLVIGLGVGWGKQETQGY